ncbi:ABC transporter ATP-binding protein [Mesorhizobium microcysteis]|uniref:ABC transporter ATP-binding protein n=1 Tax=Neoaquamicrobium microcysteis TaxID=2682781 RepID=A0A5D4H316_9HYPH|nr:ABC transporter ATP-binding protein [Mesorhizobium microcysteis]TYR33220.1 ABC transporter ATP-binding protein [Mesorhizobium microcysteis]
MTKVSITKLTKNYGPGIRAVDSISLDIPSGEFVSLLGPSGCGKTTTLKMLAGFESVTSGGIAFDGQDVVSVPPEKRDIGMVFQNYALFPHMTVRGNLAFGLEMRKVPKADMDRRIQATLDLVQLTPYADRYPRQLSGGQQQRVAIGRALVIEPRILLLDEPLANLDAKLREEMRVFIRDLQRRVGITTVYVTHDQAEAMTMSDRVVVMFGGKIAQQGRPGDIYDYPVSRAVAGFVGQVNLIDGKIVGVDSGIARVDTPFGPAEVKAGHRTEGDPVTLVLRPEAIDILPADAAGGVTASVVASYFSGAILDYTLALQDGQTVDVKTIARQRFEPGAQVRLAVDAHRFWPLEVG